MRHTVTVGEMMEAIRYYHEKENVIASSSNEHKRLAMVGNGYKIVYDNKERMTTDLMEAVDLYNYGWR